MRSSILRSSSLIALLSLFGPAAYAACTTTGTDTDCTGTSTGQQNLVGDDQTVTVETGATVTSSDTETLDIVGSRLDIVNNGEVLNTSTGFAIRTNSNSGPVSFTNTGLVRSVDGTGAFVSVNDGDLTVDNSGTIEGLGAFGFGLQTQVTNGNNVVSNSGTISTSSSSEAISAGALAGTVTITNSGTATSLLGSAISGGGNGEVTITNSGQATGGDAGIVASSNADISILNSGEVTGGSLGILTNSAGGLTTIENQGDIFATAANGFGIRSIANGAGTSGEINTSGTIDSVLSGIFLTLTDSSSSSVVNSGSITTSATTARASQNSGILVRGEAITNLPTVSVTNEATGEITTSGTGANGIQIDMIGTANIVGRNDGAITTAGIVAHGLSGEGEAGTISLTNTGTINASGTGSAAIRARSDASDIEIVNSGDIDATSAVLAGSASGDVSVRNDGNSLSRFGIQISSASGNASILNTGRVESDAAFRSGVYAYTYSGSASVVNTGDIISAGDGSAGMAATTYGYAAVTTDLSADNSGSIVTTGDNAAGIEVAVFASGYGTVAAMSAVNTVDGDITTSGNSSHGIFFDNRSAGDIAGSNAGSIETTGENASGIEASTADGAVSLSNSGTISVSGAGAVGISAASSADASIVNTGDISSAGQAISFSGNGAGLALTSSGTIRGDIDLAGSVDTVTISGLVEGSISLGANDDTLIYSGGANGGLNGNLDGGAGTDTLTFAATERNTFSATAAGFETIDITGLHTFDGAALTGAGAFTISASGDLAISAAGASIESANGLSNAGVLTLLPGAVLDIQTGGFSALDGSRTVFGVDAATPQIVADGAITFASGSQIEIDVLDVDTLVNGRSFDAAVSGTSVTDASGDLIDNSVLFDFIKEVVGGDTLRVTMNQTLQIDDVVNANDLSALGAAQGLQAIVDAGGVSGIGLSTLFGQLPDDASVVNGVEQFLPGDSGGILDTAAFMSNAAGHSIMDSVQHREPTAADAVSLERGALNLWGNAVVGKLDGDASGFTSGFDGSLSGFVMGLDRTFISTEFESLFGLSLYTLDGDVNEETIARNDSDIESTGINVYAQLKSQSWRAFAQLGTGSLDVTTQRENALLGEAVRSAYSGSQNNISAFVDYTISHGTWQFIPRGELSYVSTDLDAYTEQASLGALAIGDQTSSATTARAELEATTIWQAWEGTELRPDLRVSLATVSADSDALSAQFVDGGNPFSVSLAERDGGAFGLGVGLSLATDSGLSVRVSYDGDFADTGARQVARIRVATRF